MRVREVVKSVLSLAVICFCTVCVASPLRVSFYVGKGTMGAGFQWLRLLSSSREIKLQLVDDRLVRDGRLSGQEVLVVPGGWPSVIWETLGAEGTEKVRRFVCEGGKYVGTCAGAWVALNEPGACRLLPYRQDPSNTPFDHGHATLAVDVNERGAEALGVDKGRHFVSYWQGPLVVPEPLDGVKAEVLATFAGNVNMERPAAPSMFGYPALIGAEYGKGRVLVSIAHPESHPRSWDMVAGAFRYLTGRTVTFRPPSHRRRALRVGVFSDFFCGVGTAETLLKLMRIDGVDAIQVGAWSIREDGASDIDVLVFPDGWAEKYCNAFGDLAPHLKTFFDQGGRCVGWGAGATVDGSLHVEDLGAGEKVLSALAELVMRQTPNQ